MTVYCEEFSHKTLSHVDMTKYDLNGRTIRSSVFSREQPYFAFAEDVQNLTLVNCNLDNCFLPDGVTLIDCQNRFFLPHNDGNDWEVDDQGFALRLLNEPLLTVRGITPPTPEDIPDDPVSVHIDYLDTARNVRA